MFCNVCGHSLNEGGFCPICGWAMSADSTNSIPQNFSYNQAATPVQPTSYIEYGQPQYAQPQYAQSQQFYDMRLEPDVPKKKSKLPLIIGISVVVIGLILLIVFIIIKNKPKDYTKNRETTGEQQTTIEVSSTDGSTTETFIQDAEEGSKTIMIYMVGSNLESDYGSASSDISEMLAANYDYENVHVIIYTGGCYDWYNPDIPDNQNSIILLDNGDLTVLDELDEKNMGDPNTLSEFLTYGYDNFPAEQYGLILWNHGGGAFWGYGQDELTDDSLYLDELDEAFLNSPFSQDNKLEWIGFDACLMSTIETAHTLSPYANYMISSQELEPGWGWDYTFLEAVDGSSSGKETGTAIVDYYISYSEESISQYPYTKVNVTLSVLDLSETENVETALNELFEKANDDLCAKTYPVYSRIRSKTKEIAAEYTGEYSYDVIDLADLASNMGTVFNEEANNLNNALKKFVVYNGSNEVKANGVSIYYPYNAKEGTAYYIPTYSTFDFALEYTSFIANFSVLLTGENTLTADWDISTLVPVLNDDYSFDITLTQEQAANVQNIYYVISRADMTRPDNYYFVSMSNQVSSDDNGTYTAEFDGDIIYMQNDTTHEQCEVMYTVLESTDNYTRYLLSSILYNESIEEEDAMYVYFVLETDSEHPEGQIIGAYPISNLINSEGTDLFPDRYEIDIFDYTYIAFGALSHEFTSNEDLTNLNEADWEDLVLEYYSFPVTDGFSTITGSMYPDVPYFGMFIIEDLQGNRHCSNLVQIR